MVVIDHPIASKGKQRIQEMAQQSAREVTGGLTFPDGEPKSG